jgi:hypothetical protein
LRNFVLYLIHGDPCPTEPCHLSKMLGAFFLTIGFLSLSLNEEGSIVSIADTNTGTEYVEQGKPRRALFTLNLVDKTHVLIDVIESDGFRNIIVNTRGKRSEEVHVSFKQHPRYPTLNCTALFRRELVDESVRSTLLCDPPSHVAVRSAVFPQFNQPSSLGPSDSIATPWYEGMVVNEPGLKTQAYNSTFDLAPNGNGLAFPWTQYPGFAAFQFFSRYCAKSGLYIATYDVASHPKNFDFASNAEAGWVRLDILHLQPEILGAIFAPPYETVFRLYTPDSTIGAVPFPEKQRYRTVGLDWGGWMVAAAMYKKWAVRNAPWAKERLAQRTDLPRWLFNGTAAVITNLCPASVCEKEGFDPDTFGPNLEKLPTMFSAYRKKAGLPSVIGVVYGWEKNGVWAGQDYFPPKPSAAAWKTATERLMANGDRAGLLISGFWMRKARNATRYGPAFEISQDIFQDLKSSLVRNPDGSLATEQDNVTLVGISHRLCHGSRRGQMEMEAIFSRALEMAPVVSFDQEMGGAADFPCFAENHGHPPGRGNWEFQHYKDLLGKIRAKAIASGKEVVLMQEQGSEGVMPYMGMFWSRQFWQVESQGAKINLVGINAVNAGIFSYMYHEFALSLSAAQYQGQGSIQPVGAEPFELRAYVIFSGIARGLMPSPFANDVNQTVDVWHSKIADANRRANQIWVAWAASMLAASPVSAPPRIDGPFLETFETLKNGTLRNLTLPAVRVGTYIIDEDTDGTFTLATVILNTLHNKIAKVNVTMDWKISQSSLSPIEVRDGANQGKIIAQFAPNTRLISELPVPSWAGVVILVRRVELPD